MNSNVLLCRASGTYTTKLTPKKDHNQKSKQQYLKGAFAT